MEPFKSILRVSEIGTGGFSDKLSGKVLWAVDLNYCVGEHEKVDLVDENFFLLLVGDAGDLLEGELEVDSQVTCLGLHLLMVGGVVDVQVDQVKLLISEGDFQ